MADGTIGSGVLELDLNLTAEQALAERQRRGLVITSQRAPWQVASPAATGI